MSSADAGLLGQVDLYVRAPGLAAAWEAGQLVVIEPSQPRAVAVSAELVRLLDGAGKPHSVDEMAQTAAVPRELVHKLISTGLLIPADESTTTDALRDPAGLNAWELAVLRLAGAGAARKSPHLQPMPSARKADGAGGIELRAPPLGRTRLDTALRRRRSSRSYAATGLSMAELSQLLCHSAAVTSSITTAGVSFRPFPSGGGRHPLEIYVLAARIENLAPGAYWFDAHARTLVAAGAQDEGFARVWADLGARVGGWEVAPPAILLITAVFGRTAWKYEHLALALIYRDAGALLQNLYLVSAALGLVGCAIGGGSEFRNARWLGLDPMAESQVAAFSVGRPAEGGGRA
jgi:SagB-type dehydrogenase family enzyme